MHEKFIFSISDISMSEEIYKIILSKFGEEGCFWNEFYPTKEDVVFDIENKYLYVLKTDKGEVVAFCSIMPVKNSEYYSARKWQNKFENPCVLMRLAVKNGHTNKGLATEMFNEILTNSTGIENYDGACLMVSKYNESACHIYEKYGFVLTGEETDEHSTWLRYEKRLK